MDPINLRNLAWEVTVRAAFKDDIDKHMSKFHLGYGLLREAIHNGNLEQAIKQIDQDIEEEQNKITGLELLKDKLIRELK